MTAACAPAQGGTARRLLEPADWVLMGVLMVLGLALRLRWWSGYGLGDDANFRATIETIVRDGRLTTAYSYRATWWLPTALACRWLGLTEQALILPITTISTLGIGLLYAFGKQLWGRQGGVVAALLTIVHPLDFAWSTMLANDLYQSFFAALSVLLFLRASDAGGSLWKRRLFFFSALALFLAYHAKSSALALAPALLLMAWWRRARVYPEVTTFAGVALLLFGLGALVSIALTGGPFGPYEIDMWLGGLRQPEAVRFHPLTWYDFMTYPRMLFLPDHLGDRVHSVYAPLLVLFALLAWPLRLRSSKEVWAWFLAVFCAMQFQMNRVDGVWVSMFRNVRHGHAFVYPMTLLLAGYLCALRERFPRVARILLVGVLLYSTFTSISVASKSRQAFGDARAAAQVLATLPRKPVYSDPQLGWWIPMVAGGSTPIDFHPLEHERPKRIAQIAGIREGYLVTGGGREPYYGCYDCIPDAAELPPGRWRLVRELPGPTEPVPWRREPVRIWEALPDGP